MVLKIYFLKYVKKNSKKFKKVYVKKKKLSKFWSFFLKIKYFY